MNDDQVMELEALESIYGADFKRLDGGAAASKPTFEVTLVPHQDGEVNHVAAVLTVEWARPCR